MTEVDEESSSGNETENNVGVFLSKQLDRKRFYEVFIFLSGQWFDSDIMMKGYRWLFKFVLLCI